ncbi:MAG: fused MFS/spermidine synthase [Desulfobacterales bacterium]|nr:fused MFS/spermidine synthase [Desulfobacterales bacterium]
MKSKAVVPTSVERLAKVILACFFLSGTTALVYEIIWMRMISQVIGGAPFAVSTILVVFMGGMGLGSYLAGRRADTMEPLRLVRMYGLLELSIGLYALCVPILLMLLKLLYGVLYNALFAHPLAYHLTIFAGAVVLLCPPAVCMGATLPFLCKFYVSRLAHLGTHAGRLYGLNTIGAALGSLLCGFWLIDLLGIWGTMLTAMAVNCTIGVVCLRIGSDPAPVPEKGKAKTGPRKAPPTATEIATEPAAPERAAVVRGALLIFFVSGFCAMAYEVLWTKLLGLVVGPTTYSFTIVLVTFIVGLALGNLYFGRRADRSPNPIGLLVATQLAAALLALLVSHLLGNGQLFFAKLIYTYREHFALLSLAKALVLFVFMAAPTFLLGATFPLVTKIYTRSVSDVGRTVGMAYAVNTIGAVLGSFCAGFVLIPLVGKENGLRLTIALQIAIAAGVGFAALGGGKHSVVSRWAALAATLVVGLWLCVHYPAWNRHILATGKYHRFEEHLVVDEMLENTGWRQALFQGPEILMAAERGELVYYGDGIGGFTTVLKYPGPFGVAEYSMANSGKMDASSIGDMKTQTLLAHFPMLFARDPKNVMVLGLASGITAGEVLHYPVKQLDVVDINERVFEAARFFEPWNNGVLTDPRTRLIVQDGMAHLGLTDTRYDVIISEPSNPWMAGMAALFTREFFASAKAALAEEGIYVQWFHCYQMDWEAYALIGRTFAEVFPQSLLVSCEPGGLGRDYLFVGFKNSSGLNWARARVNLTHAQRSKNIQLAKAELFLRLIVSEDLKQLFGPGALNTEDRPRLEYAAPKLMYAGEETQQALLGQLESRRRLRAETVTALEAERRSVTDQIDFAAYALSVHAPFADMVDLANADPGEKARFFALLEAYAAQNSLDFSLIHDPALAQRLREVQISSIERKLSSMQSPAVAHLHLGERYSELDKPEPAITHYKEAARLDPENAAIHNNLGYMLYEQGQVAEALEHYKEAVRLRPNFILALGNLAFAHLEHNELDPALHYFQQTLRVQPDIAESHYNIGAILLKKEQTGPAVAHLQTALALAPEMVSALNLLALIQATTAETGLRNPKAALANARKACALTEEKDPVLLSTLALAYAADGQKEASLQTSDKALRIARESGEADLVARIEAMVQKIK